MKRIQYCLIIIVCLLIVSCKARNNYSSKEVKKIFNEKEIKDLTVLVDYFESKIRVEGKDMESCYKDWIKTLAGQEGPYDIKIFNFEEQKELYKKIDTSTFHEIWYFSKVYGRFRNKEYTKNISPNLEGKYLKFLKLVGKERSKVNQLAEEIEGMNDFDNILFLFFEPNGKKEIKITGDFTDFNNKLIVTIHTLDYVDANYRKEKWID